MKKRNILAMIMAAVMAFSMIGCGEASSDKEVNVDDDMQNAHQNDIPEDSSEKEVNEKFILGYPEDMQALGFTEPLELEKVPERVVSLSTAPVLALYELGVNLVGVPSSSVVTWPEELQSVSGMVSFNAMTADDFDYESVVALDPDLVILSAYGAKTAGETLGKLGIPCYYVYSGHTVSYDSIKMQTEALIDAFGTDDEKKAAGEAIRKRFSDLEEDIATTAEYFGGTKVMVLQSGGTSHYIQTKDGTLGSMADMIGFENVYVNSGSSMVQLDFEQALEYNPDLLMCVGGTDAETHKTIMETAFAENKAYWYAIPAVENGRILYLPVEFCSTAGINVINNIYHLIDAVCDFYHVQLELKGSAQ